MVLGNQVPKETGCSLVSHTQHFLIHDFYVASMHVEQTQGVDGTSDQAPLISVQVSPSTGLFFT